MNLPCGAGLGGCCPSLPSLTAPRCGLVTEARSGGAVERVWGAMSGGAVERVGGGESFSSSTGREESHERSLFSLLGERHSSGGKVTCGGGLPSHLH